MAKIIWSQKAVYDLKDIVEFIAKDSKKYARITGNKLIAKPDILKTNPYLGRVVPELMNESIRELIDGSYRIIYEIMPDESISILTIHHSARLFRL